VELHLIVGLPKFLMHHFSHSLSLSVSMAFTIPKREGVERFGEGGATDGASRWGWRTGKGHSGLSSRAVAGNTDT